MSDQDCLYGVYTDVDQAETIVSELHEAGIETSRICVVGKEGDSEFARASGRIRDPFSRHFFKFGIVGGLLGVWAGIAYQPSIPYVVSFQILYPLMTGVSGAIVFAYFAVFICAFLEANQPHHWGSVFEGEVQEGSVIILAETISDRQHQAAFEILSAHRPIELVIRRKQGVHAEPVLPRFSPAVVTSASEPEALSVVA